MGDCNKNKCKPTCSPCTTQPKIHYCGQPVECLKIKRGDKLDNIIKTIGDKVCQLQTYTDLMTYVNVIDATEEQCEYGGYVIQVLGTVNNEIVSEHVVCNESVLSFFNNDNFISVPNSVTFNNGDGVDVEASDDGNGYITYAFNLSDVEYEDITWQEGMDLINSEEVKVDKLYHVTDRGWYIRGILPNEFSTDGYIKVQCPRSDFYTFGSSIKSVWNPFDATYSVGDLVVYGGRVWENITGSVGTSLNMFKLSTTDWQEMSDNSYYTDIFLRMHYNYVDDWVFRFEDKRNNTINIPKDMYGILPSPTQHWADWNTVAAFSNNNCQPVLNNFRRNGAPPTIISNIGHFDILGNKANIIGYNRCTLTIRNNNSANIAFNVSTSFVGNTCNIIMFNTGNGEAGQSIVSGNTSSVISSNIIQSQIADNTIPTIANNIVNGDVLRNDLMTFSSNTVMNVISDNTSSGAKKSNFTNNIVNGDIKNNIISSRLSYNKFSDNIENNEGITIIKSNIDSSITGNLNLTLTNSQLHDICSGNTSVVINKSTILGSVSNNTDTSIDRSELSEVSENNDVDFINGKCYRLRNNIGSYFSTNFIDFEIEDNENITALNNFCISILGNKNVVEMRYNNTRGSIAYNEDFDKIIWNSCGRGIDKNKATGYTGCEITYNTNAGLISRNIFQNNSVTISNNNNNGNIGNDLSDTNRATSVSGTIVDI